jgi:hypothetical protein
MTIWEKLFDIQMSLGSSVCKQNKRIQIKYRNLKGYKLIISEKE